MSNEPFALPQEPRPDDIPAADPGQAAPAESPGFGEDVDPDVSLDADGETLAEELRDRPAPPFRTPGPEQSS